MNRIYALFLRQRDDSVYIQIGLNRPFSFPDLVCFVRLETVQAEAVFLGINRHRAQPELGGGAHDSDGDFTTIESQKLLHGGKLQNIMELSQVRFRNCLIRSEL